MRNLTKEQAYHLKKFYYVRVKELYDSIPENVRVQIIMGIKNRMYREGLVLEKITFEDWIKKINDGQGDT